MYLNSFTDVHAALQRYQRAHAPGTYTLDTMQALMTHLNHPHEKFQTVHVAGTSGKTSTAYFIARLLAGAGHKVGLTVSPHVTEINERTQINMQPLPEEAYCSLMEEFLGLIRKSKLQPSYYELLVAFSFWVFAKLNVEYAVVEVGLGGLLDGTNVIKRADKVCVITDIGFDHTEILGNTLKEITAQKAGIIKSGNAVFMHSQTDEIESIVREKVHEMGASLTIFEEEGRPLPIVARYQKRNFSLALHTVRQILKSGGRSLPEHAVKQAMQPIPGRFEIYDASGKLIVLDGAHNTQKMKTLAKSLEIQFPDKRFLAVVAMGRNKQTQATESLIELRNVCRAVIITEFGGAQDELKASMVSTELAEAIRKKGFQNVSIIQNPHEAVMAALESQDRHILITGSLYLIERVRPVLAAPISGSERH